MSHLSLRLPDDLSADLDKVAAEANVSRSWLAREILRYALRNQSMPALFTLPEHRPGEQAVVEPIQVGTVPKATPPKIDNDSRLVESEIKARRAEEIRKRPSRGRQAKPDPKAGK